MSSTTFARVAAPSVRSPGELVISLCLVHLLRNSETRDKLIGRLIENPADFHHFVDLLVPCGSRYLREISMLTIAARGRDHLREGIYQAYERHIGIIYFDGVQTATKGMNGHRKVEVVSEESWKIFLENCAKRPEMAFVIDIARRMTSPFGNKHFVPDETANTIALPVAPMPAGMH